MRLEETFDDSEELLGGQEIEHSLWKRGVTLLTDVVLKQSLVNLLGVVNKVKISF